MNTVGVKGEFLGEYIKGSLMNHSGCEVLIIDEFMNPSLS